MRATALLIVTMLGTYPFEVAAQSNPTGWQREACRAVGVVVMKYPKGHSGTRGACVAIVVDPDGGVLVPRHCVENALSAEYKPLPVPSSGKSRKYPVTGIYDAPLTEAERNGKAARADVIRIHVDFGDDEVAAVPIAGAIPTLGSADLVLLVNRGTKRGKPGKCGALEVELLSTFDAAGSEGRTIQVDSVTKAGGSGSPVFDGGRLVGFITGGEQSAHGAMHDIVVVVVDHPALRRNGTLRTFAAYADVHKTDALSRLYNCTGDCAHDMTHLDQAVALDPTLSSAWYRKAACAQLAGDDEIAVELVATAVKHDPKRRSLFELGRMSLRNDLNVEQGRAALLAALQIDPDYYPARFVLVASYAEKGEFEPAKMHLSIILNRWPSDAEEVLSGFEEYYPDMVVELRAEMSDRD